MPLIPAALDALKACLGSHDGTLAAAALARSGSGMSVLVDALGDRQARVRRHAADALVASPVAPSTSLYDELARLSRARDARVRTAVANLLTRLPRDADAEGAIERLARDRAPAVRKAASAAPRLEPASPSEPASPLPASSETDDLEPPPPEPEPF
jgi:hypothetical protein